MYDTVQQQSAILNQMFTCNNIFEWKQTLIIANKINKITCTAIEVRPHRWGSVGSKSEWCWKTWAWWRMETLTHCPTGQTRKLYCFL